MKKATLCGTIGVIINLLLQLFWTVSDFAGTAYDISVARFTELIGMVGWLLIGYFFVELYKKQK